MSIDIHTLNAKSRSRNIKIQTGLSFVIKGLSILLSLYLVPLTINYLGKESYGIWVTMLSIISWISICDIGIGHGLRNKIAESMANGEKTKSCAYVSTAYILIFGISACILIISFIVFPFFNWEKFFNSGNISIPYVQIMLSFISFISIILSLGIINSILSACQLNSYTGIIPFASSLLFTCVLIIFSKFFYNNLLYIVLAYGLCNILSLTIVTIIFFRKFSFLKPKISFFEKALIKDIVSLGIDFFIIQVAAILIFSTSNILITQFLGPDRVTDYNIVFKIFSVFIMGSSIILAPYWSAYTEAYSKKDFTWIIKSLKKLLIGIIPLLFALILLNVFIDKIIKIWLPDHSIYISKSLIIVFTIYVFIAIWNNIFSFFLNGISKTKLQIKTSIIGATSIIPLSYIFVKILHCDLTGIVIAMCISLLPFFIGGPIETYKILKHESSCEHINTSL